MDKSNIEAVESLHHNQQKNIAHLSVDPGSAGSRIPKTIFGNFLEHLGFSIQGGIWAQELSNPVFSRECNLLPAHKADLLLAGQRLVELYRKEGNSQGIPLDWTPVTEVTGFGVCALDDWASSGIPFPWAPVGIAGSVGASVGRLGGAIRLIGAAWQGKNFPSEVSLDDGPGGVRQGIFLPVHRCREYKGYLWLRIATLDPQAHGVIEIGLRRRIGNPADSVGEILACQHISLSGCEWRNELFHLILVQGSVKQREPVDFYIRWMPTSGKSWDLLVDSAFMFPDDALEGFDPEIISLTRDWPVPLLRWPGGNYISQYHWRDGVGSIDLRPTRINQSGMAWIITLLVLVSLSTSAG